jgi:hypothetical protein
MAIQQKVLTLSDVVETDRKRIIELYRSRPILWVSEMPPDREKTKTAWDFIAETSSSYERKFEGELVPFN